MNLLILPTILLGLTALGTPATAAETEFPFAAGTDRAGRAQALSDAAGRVMIESPEFPRGLWVHLADDAGQALPDIQVEYQGGPDSLAAIWSVDPSGLRQETLLWTRPGGDALRLTLQAADPADLPPGLAFIDWRIDPGAEELLAPEEGPELIGWEAGTAFLQERWHGRTGRAAVRIDSSTALAVNLDHPEPAERLVEYLGDRTRNSLGEEVTSHVKVLLTPQTFDRELALLEDSIVLTTSFVLVPGSELERWVLLELGRSNGPVTLSEASAVTWLDIGYEEIDLSSLAALTGLEELWLNDNGIADLSPLASLTRLEVLSLEFNEIVDVSPLAALTSLVDLRLGGNQIADVSPLATLASLEVLWLDINRIVDLNPLAALASLKSLFLSENRIADVSPLAALTSLKGLALQENRIVDVSPLAALTDMERLNLVRNRIVDVSPLAVLTSLEGLGLVSNQIVDVSPLASLTRLKGLGLGYNQIVDVSPLAALTGLESLGLPANRIVDVQSLANLTNLAGLSLAYNDIVDVSPLTALTRLEWLELHYNEIVDAGPLAALTGLGRLDLDSNEIVDASPLASLTRLVQLELRANKIQDISPLVANTGLGEGDKVDLRDNPLSARAILEQIPALRARGVEVTF